MEREFFVDEFEAEQLARKHLENYVNECRVKSRFDVMLAVKKMQDVSDEAGRRQLRWQAFSIDETSSKG